MLKHLLERSKKYQAVLGWVLRDSILRFPKKVILILVSGFLGIALQLQAIAFVVYYAQTLESGRTLEVFQTNLDFRSSKFILLCFGIIIFTSLILAAWFNYYSRNRVLKLWRTYEEFSAKRIFKIMGEKRLAISFSDYSIIEDDITLLKIVRTDARYCGRVLEIILSSFTPTITAIISVGALVYLNFLLTLILVLPLSATMIFWYQASREASSNASLLEKYSSGASSEYRSLIRWFKQDNYSLSSQDIETIYDNLESSKLFLDAFEGRLNSLAKSDLASNVFVALTVFIILIVLGLKIISQQTGWGELIIYVVALRYSLFNLRQVTQKFTAINLFYPHLRRYFHFLTIAKYLKEQYKIKKHNLTIKKFKIKYSENSYEIEVGSNVALITSNNFNQYHLFNVLKSLLNHSEEVIYHCASSAYFVAARTEYLPNIPLNIMLSIPNIYTRSLLVKNLKGSGMEEKIEQELPNNLNIPVNKTIWEEISLEVKLTVRLSTIDGYQWVFLEEVFWKKLPKVTQEFFLKRSIHTNICLIFNKTRINNLGQWGEELVIVFEDGQITFVDKSDHFLSYSQENKDNLLSSVLNQDHQANYFSQEEINEEDETLTNL